MVDECATAKNTDKKQLRINNEMAGKEEEEAIYINVNVIGKKKKKKKKKP